MSLDHLYTLWRELKFFLQFSGRVGDDVVHIHFGLLAFFMFYWVFRKAKNPETLAWVGVFTVQFLNECIDVLFDLLNKGTVKEWNLIEDFTSTLLWPTVLVVFLKIIGRRKERLDDQSE